VERRCWRSSPRKTSKNQLTLPKKVVDRFPDVEYFEVLVHDSRISLVPVRPGQMQDVQRRLERLGISEENVADAVAWGTVPDLAGRAPFAIESAPDVRNRFE
jgi:hypothetical protein